MILIFHIWILTFLLDILCTNGNLRFICRQSRSNPIRNEIEYLDVEQMGRCLKREKDKSLWKLIIGSEECTNDISNLPVATETYLSKNLKKI